MFNTLPRTALRRSRNSIKVKLEDRKYSKLQRSRSHAEFGSRPAASGLDEVRSPIELQSVGAVAELEGDGGVGLRVEKEKEDVKREEVVREVEVDGVKFTLEVRKKDAKVEFRENEEVEVEAGERLEVKVGRPERRGSQKHSKTEKEDGRVVIEPPTQPSETSKLGPVSLKGAFGRGLQTVIRFWGYQDLLVSTRT
ncbi:uncharacterized protein LY89DRAFT_743855 [Mollisia scopiformis]|uniref:Uncharacterized protein n=1 Tax=Mollisia scopiformis TaxID=149040 RepID=A0A132B1W5_MOLSC|nr:uncharacterized protein LY89DRAFT_743855 [Mollisia scopiformis]KUJ06375.1 hypothetical protein LY89DRAFT_743855 [Mollisia scopiformis]